MSGNRAWSVLMLKSWNFMARAESERVPWPDLHFRNKNLCLLLLFLVLMLSQSAPPPPPIPLIFLASYHIRISLGWLSGLYPAFRSGCAPPSQGEKEPSGAAACSPLHTQQLTSVEEAPTADSLSWLRETWRLTQSLSFFVQQSSCPCCCWR